jgi:hypothetical protein
MIRRGVVSELRRTPFSIECGRDVSLETYGVPSDDLSSYRRGFVRSIVDRREWDVQATFFVTFASPNTSSSDR